MCLDKKHENDYNIDTEDEKIKVIIEKNGERIVA